MRIGREQSNREGGRTRRELVFLLWKSEVEGRGAGLENLGLGK